LTVEQNIRFYGRLHGMNSQKVTLLMTRTLRYFRLRGIELVKVKYLSEAERKKASLILAFIGSPSILLLDEVTSGMEPEGQRKALNLVRKYCKERGAAVVMATHNIKEAEDCCDRVIVLKNGVMKCCGTPTRMRMMPAQ
jgi:ABC-type multidrug transport system ATPase subunit